MATHTYPGFAYKQNPNPETPWIISFVARAEDLRSWAGIPRRSEQGLVGFQRSDDPKRVAKAKAFFDNHSSNQSPTSIVIGVHPSPPGREPRVRLEFEEGSNGEIRACKLTVMDDADADLTRVIAIIRSQIESRLANEAANAGTEEGDGEEEADGSAEATVDEASDETRSTNEDEDEEDESATSGVEEEIEIGRSLLTDLLTKLSDRAWCEAHEDDLRDLAKPATIIDGQHRIKGAELCERGIPFSVCAIFDCEWPEQVFHFTVVNYTATGIPDQFITANAALSLTALELEGLRKRLVQAGVKVIEYELMRVVNFDHDSPFYDLVNLTTKKVEDRLGYKTMVGVAKAWFTGKNPAVAQIIEHAYPDVKGKKSHARSERLQRWKDEDGWGLFFKDFWQQVREHFENHKTDGGVSLWSVGNSNLLLTVVLAELQEAFLTNLAAQDETFFETNSADPVAELRAKIRSRASKFITYFEPEFFARTWKMKSLSVGPGRAALRETFRSIVDKKGDFKYGNSSLVTGKTN